MNIQDFKRIITSFADRPADIDIEKGHLIAEIRGELIEARIIIKEGILYIQEHDMTEIASSWIKNKIACLYQLADRIIDYTKTETTFINPTGVLLDELEYDSEEKEQKVNNITDKISEILGRKVAGTSSILYLTSNAGEGKSTLINNLAVIQAKKFKSKETDWLLLPIPLGGKPFLRFDDIVIGSIVQNLRFRYYFYESFIELIKLGMIVPAFDGFEEMFMQGAPGEALSATGNLVNKLDSSGTMLIAARKAYFDYKSFSSQAKLFDTINSSVSFARLEINRWDKEQFIEYAKLKNIQNPEKIYEITLRKFNNDSSHPILTRPVLIKQLLTVFVSEEDIGDLINKLGSSINYFPSFVEAIIHREANTKWIDKSGEPLKPLLSVEQHYQLLSAIAEDMWLNNTDSLKDNVLDIISDLFSETNKLPIQIAIQVRERIKQHALILRGESNTPTYKFDHEEFSEFFLGVSIADKIYENKQIIAVKTLFRQALFPVQTCESIALRLKSKEHSIGKIISFINDVMYGESPTSFAKENAGNIIIRIINNEKIAQLIIDSYEVPSNSFVGINIENITFNNCHFQNSSLDSTKIRASTFKNCYFDRLEINSSTTFIDVTITDCQIGSIYDMDADENYYNPNSIFTFLSNKGITISDKKKGEFVQKDKSKDDEDLQLIERVLRKFTRSNRPVTETILKLRVGRNKGEYFIKEILPILLKKEVFIELEHTGQGQNRRFKLGVSFSKIDSALNTSKGSFSSFIGQF